ncbi:MULTISPECIES: serine/threonine-protein kinase [Streptomyces]|uniref:serine/threonine-protein kinase n=1 Tax=Streptomyces TaxID=1883 RepID=UPI000AE40FBD|nr:MULTISPECIES: serine/threonine-protein kinase [Streptomyces]
MGETIGGRYRLLDKLGRGGMGEVWRARDLSLQRDVAVKRSLADGPFRGEKAKQRFLREARLTARIAHPAVPTVHDWGTDDHEDGQTLYLVMELVRGHTLEELLCRQGGRFSCADVVSVADQVADALAHAHRLGVVHRDLKPSNVMLTADGRAKVLDFGIAAALEPDEGEPVLTGTGDLPGTAGFIAPERAKGGPATPSGDFYALGCMLYELLTGKPPLTAGSPWALVYRHIQVVPPPVATHRGDIPPELAALVDSLLAKSPDDRPTADRVRVVARRCLEPSPGSGPGTPRQRTGPVSPPGADQAPRSGVPHREGAAPSPQAPGPQAPNGVASVADRLRRCRELFDQERYSEAYDGYHRLGAQLRRSRPQTDRDVLVCRAGVAACLAELGSSPEALADLERLLPVQQRVLGVHSVEAFDTWFRIAELKARMGRTREARGLLAELRDRQAEVLPDSHERHGRVGALLSRLDRVLGVS